MFSRSKLLMGLMALVLSVSMLAVIACGSADEPTAAPAKATATKVPAAAPTTAAAQPTVPAATSVPVSTPALPAPAPTPPKVTPATPAPTTFKYVPVRATPDNFFVDSDYYKGPIPTKFNESPMSAALVKAGKILPLEQRLPVPEDVRIYPPSDEIGVYGGVMRWTDSGANFVDQIATTAGGLSLDPTGQYMTPSAFKDFQASADGRTYTFTIRKGARWHDGYPYTMEDHRFAIEDQLLNKELMPGLPSDLISPISGKDMKFKVIDETHFQISFDDPQFSFSPSSSITVYSGQRGCPRCFTSPAHVMKRFHTKYNAAEIPALLTKYNQPDWVKLFTFARAVRSFPGVPSEPIPTKFDPNYIYKGADHYLPWRGAWYTTVLTPNRVVFGRNHYFFGVDPEGNQLPYMDGVESYVVESREVAVFRTMAGEADFNRNALTLAELPLYIANMQKGDYTLMKYIALDGADLIWSFGQEYATDPEIGKLMRTQDFRMALTKAWDRKAANESQAAGFGVPQQIAPHPSTPYSPSDQWRYYEVKLDVAGAKALMAKMGYKDTDGDGYLNRLDGKGNLELFHSAYNLAVYPYFPYVQLMQADFKNIGIKLNIAEGNPAGFFTDPQTDYQFLFSHTEGGVNPWSSSNQRFIPVVTHTGWPAVGSYYVTRGEKGMAPTGPDAKWTDIYGKMAPAGTYPVDISGAAKKLQDIYTEGQVLGTFAPRRIELGKLLFQTNAEYMLKPNGLAYSGIQRALRIKRNNLRNVPRNGTTGNSPEHDTLYFEGGIDNLYHAGNKSKSYKSMSFTDPAYWNPVLGQ